MKNNRTFLEKLLDGAKVEWKPLGKVTDIKTGQSVNKNIIAQNPGIYPVINSGREPLGFINVWNTENDPIGITTRGAGVGSITWQEGKYFRGNLNYSVTIKSEYELNVRFLYHVLLHFQKEIHNLCSFTGIPALNASELKKLEIPIPPLPIQTKIVKILDALTELTSELTSELTLRRKQYEYYREKLLSEEELGKVGFEWKFLKDIFNIFVGGDFPREFYSQHKTQEFNIPILSNGTGNKSLYGWTNKAKINKPSLTISARGTIGWTSYREEPFYPIVRLLVLTPKIELNLKYAYHFMKMIENNYKVPESGISQLTKPMIEELRIPVPSFSEQQSIASILDKFETLTNSITEGLPLAIEQSQKRYEYYRELLLNFPGRE